MGMWCARPFAYDYRMPRKILKSLPIIDEETIIGFMDESSPTDNCQYSASLGTIALFSDGGRAHFIT